LLNTPNLAAVQDLDAYPEVAESTVNFGIPDLAGRTASSFDANAVAQQLKRAILRFEPRLLKKSVKVRLVVDPDSHSPNAVSFAVEAELWSQPLPLKLYFRTDLDLEDGEARVTEVAAG
jgi:type VI secretion system protein ImpF